MRSMLAAIALLAAGLGQLPSAALAGEEATLYKDPDCSCCAAYADYLSGHGFEVKVVETKELDRLKRSLSVPEELAGCHTTVIGGYTVEGHVPVATLRRLLGERPEIKGLSLPGMPLGSPGMPGEKEGAFQIRELKPGPERIYAVE